MTNNYTFTYYGWIASYRDFDQDWFTVTAETLDAAWERVKRTKIFAKSEIELDSINGKKVEGEMRKKPEVKTDANEVSSMPAAPEGDTSGEISEPV